MRISAILAVLASLAAFPSAPAAATPALARVALVLEPLVSGLAWPVGITHAGDGSGRLFIVLQEGTIRIHDGTTLLPTPFLDIDPLVNCCGEEGLLGLAFHPQYESNGFFFVFYTNTASELVIARYSVSGDPNLALPASGTILMQIPHPFSNHNGGQIAFGPDGYLYIATGDGGSGGDPGNRAQNLDVPLGKLLRIDVDGGPTYTIPPDNPFVGIAGLDEIWAYGLRNPWRFSFDRLTGDLFIGDVGQGNREEIDFQPAASPGGENYGWRRMEGTACFNPSTGCNDGTLELPILEYTHTAGNCSVTGGYRYRGVQFPQLASLLVYADFCSGDISTASDASGAWTTLEQLDTSLSISTFGEDEAGELYLTRWASTDGNVYKVTALPPCDDGIDNDLDGTTDFPADPNCRNRLAMSPENPECRDGIDNDQDGASDAADAQCAASPVWWNDESKAKGACGVGVELALLTPFLLALRRARSPGA